MDNHREFKDSNICASTNQLDSSNETGATTKGVLKIMPLAGMYFSKVRHYTFCYYSLF
jgi:hypothetical protein